MRASRTYGSMRGACDETHVPTATAARAHGVIRRRGSNVAACGEAQTETPVIGFLSSGSPAAYQPFLAAFRAGLSETGFVEGKNVATEYRWAEGRYDRLAEFAAELVRRRVA